MEAPVEPFPQNIIERTFKLLSINFGEGIKNDPVFLKEVEDLKESYKEVMKQIRGIYCFFFSFKISHIFYY